MLTDAKLKSQIDSLWDKLWTGGLTNPMDAIEQFSYLLFMKRLDEAETQREKQARRRGEPYQPRLEMALRWQHWTKMTPAADALAHVKTKVFPRLREMGGEGSSFRRYMANAEFKINKPALLIEACNLIDQMHISEQQQDVQGDLYEYMLSHLSTAGRNGQFRTPRHIIRLMVQMLDPRPFERIGDLAAGTCGFPINAYQYILEKHTSPEILRYDADGWPHNLVGDLLTEEQRDFLQTEAFRAYDNDSGMTMLRIGSMNMMLHGIENPRYFYADTLSQDFEEKAEYDVVLMNPPFKGAVDKSAVHETLPGSTTKSELLFLHLILRALDMGGRAAVIVPDGVLFGSSRAHVEIRQKLVAEHGLMGVVSMPSGVFKPYAGVSTAILFFARGGSAERIWFYDMAYDGFSLDDKRQPVAENDIPDILACWQNRHDAEFAAARQAKLAELKAQLEPLHQDRLRREGEANRLTFEQVIEANGEDKAAQALAAVKAVQEQLKAQMAPLQAQIDQLGRQFWVTKKQVKANKYDLSASRYREIDQEPTFYERPQVTMKRLLTLEGVMANEVNELQKLVS